MDVYGKSGAATNCGTAQCTAPRGNGRIHSGGVGRSIESELLIPAASRITCCEKPSPRLPATGVNHGVTSTQGARDTSGTTVSVVDPI